MISAFARTQPSDATPHPFATGGAPSSSSCASSGSPRSSSDQAVAAIAPSSELLRSVSHEDREGGTAVVLGLDHVACEDVDRCAPREPDALPHQRAAAACDVERLLEPAQRLLGLARERERDPPEVQRPTCDGVCPEVLLGADRTPRELAHAGGGSVVHGLQERQHAGRVAPLAGGRVEL